MPTKFMFYLSLAAVAVTLGTLMVLGLGGLIHLYFRFILLFAN